MSTEVGEVQYPAATLSPTYFASLRLEGLDLPSATADYLDWLEGAGAFGSRAPTRRAQGVPASFDRGTLLRGDPLILPGGSALTARSRPGQVIFRFVHRDERREDLWWHSVARLTETTTADGGGAPGLVLEHAVGRDLPRHVRLPHVPRVPSVVARLAHHPEARPTMPDLVAGRPVIVARGTVAAFVRGVLCSEDRRHPYVVVSPSKQTGEPHVDVAALAESLATQVPVVVLDADATWEFAATFEALGFERALGVCFDGAVRVYQPGLGGSSNPRDHYLWLPHRVREYGKDAAALIAREVIERVTWRALPPRYFSLVDDADREARPTTLPAAETRPVGADDELAATRTERDFWRKEADRYDLEVGELRQLLEIAERERDEMGEDIQRLSQRGRPAVSRTGAVDQASRDLLRGVLRHGPRSLEEALDTLETLFADRVVVLPSARASARESASFQRSDKALELMLVLVDEYWSAVQRGGDAEGKKCFSEAAFASRESETVESRRGAREHRTFTYDGAPIVMWKHLKIGTKDSLAETWRLHFEFDARTKRVVVGHCGRHLDFK